MKIWRYNGRGRFFGVPTRDLTADQLAALPPGHQRIIARSGAWDQVDSGDLADQTMDELRLQAVNAGVPQADADALRTKKDAVKAIERALKAAEVPAAIETPEVPIADAVPAPGGNLDTAPAAVTDTASAPGTEG